VLDNEPLESNDERGFCVFMNETDKKYKCNIAFSIKLREIRLTIEVIKQCIFQTQN
jgi:hypothetical protein